MLQTETNAPCPRSRHAGQGGIEFSNDQCLWPRMGHIIAGHWSRL